MDETTSDPTTDCAQHIKVSDDHTSGNYSPTNPHIQHPTGGVETSKKDADDSSQSEYKECQPAQSEKDVCGPSQSEEDVCGPSQSEGTSLSHVQVMEHFQDALAEIIVVGAKNNIIVIICETGTWKYIFFKEVFSNISILGNNLHF